MKLKCNHCGYEWDTKSKLKFVSCPSCMKKVRNVHQTDKKNMEE